VLASGNGEDVYNDASSLTAIITGTSGGNFENLVVGTGTATANVTDTSTDATVNLSASTVTEGAVANYTFTATLSDASEGVTTIHTDQGDITIANGQTVGTLVLASGNGEDVYNDASSLTAIITGTSGGNFENLVVGTGTATANVTDTSNRRNGQPERLDGHRRCGRQLHVHGDAVGRLGRRHHDSTRTRATSRLRTARPLARWCLRRQWRGRLQRRLEPDGDHHRHLGGNFENLVVGTGTATANVTDTSTDATVNLSASTVTEGAVANYTFTATLSDASEGVTTIHTDQGDITIANGQTVGTLVLASGNGEDVYNDASSLTAIITGTSGGKL